MDAITNAGLEAMGVPSTPVSTVNPRREILKSIRSVLTNQAASEDEHIDALEALIEMSKE